MKKTLVGFMFLFLFSILLIGCSNDEAKDEGKDEAKEETNDTGKDEATGNEDAEEINIAYMAQPPSFDPHITNTVANSEISRNVFEQLLTFDSGFNVVPLLAESFEVSEDGTDMTFHLRKGVNFHNGEEMIADDVVASMERWRVNNGKALSYLSNSEFVKEDDYTVVLKMDKPLTIAKYILAGTSNFAGIFPKEVVENAEATGIKDFIGTGPYKFGEWKQDQYIHLVKNEDYEFPATSDKGDGLVGKREAHIKNAYYHFVGDSSTRTAGIQTGQYDAAVAIPSDNVPLLEPNKDVNLVIHPGGYTTSIFNKKKGLFSDVRARQAVNLAVDKESVMLSAFTSEDFFIPEHGLLSKRVTAWHNDAGKEVFEAYDPEKAKELLKEAGYNGETIRILATRDYEDQYFAGVVIQEQLERIGMKVDLQVYDWPTLNEKMQDESAYEMYVMGFSPAIEPSQIYYLDSRQKYAGWSDSAELDGLLDELMVAKSDEEAKEIFTDVQEEAWKYMPAVKYGDFSRVTATYGDVQDFEYFHGIVLWNTKLNN